MEWTTFYSVPCAPSTGGGVLERHFSKPMTLKRPYLSTPSLQDDCDFETASVKYRRLSHTSLPT
eukprot:IDg6678t1